MGRVWNKTSIKMMHDFNNTSSNERLYSGQLYFLTLLIFKVATKRVFKIDQG